ncbi:MAG: alpha/beta hydrolase [Acholeplasmatales bacterium]|nr:alpha/beta hydrolase [Acholeplasmatales bacterium]
MKKLITRSFLLTFIFTIFSSILILSTVKASEEIKDTYDIDDETLYNLTNTYDYKEVEEYTLTDDILKNISNYIRYLNSLGDSKYDLSKENDNEVIDDYPQITVFTHGWNGYACDWDSKFSGDCVDENSVIYEYYNKYNYSNVFYAQFTDESNFNVYNVTYNYKNNFKIDTTNITPVKDSFSAITDSKHSIIIFESDNSMIEHSYVYKQFNYMLSTAVLQYKKINNGKLPMINLVGHSRGGLTNLQYALDHPKLVKNMFSYDTPYLGTSTGDLAICSGFSQDIYSFFENRESLIGIGDLTNKLIFGKFYSRWNDGYDEFYKDIDVFAYGSRTVFKFFNVDSFVEYLSNTFMESTFVQNFKKTLEESYDEEFADRTIIEMIDSVGKSLYSGVEAVFQEKYEEFCDFVENFDFIQFAQDVINNVINFFKKLWDTVVGWFSDIEQLTEDIAETANEFFNIVSEEFEFNFSEDFLDIVWNNDFAVDLDSQLGRKDGQEYKGFNRYTTSYDVTYGEEFKISHLKVLDDTYYHSVTISNSDLAVSFYVDTNYYSDSFFYTLFVSSKTINIKLECPTQIQIDTVSLFNNYISIYDSNGRLLRTTKNNGSSTNSSLACYLSAGNYTITINKTSFWGCGLLLVKISYVEIPITSERYQNLYLTGKMEQLRSFTPVATDEYNFETKGSGIYFVTLYDSNMTKIATKIGWTGYNTIIKQTLNAGEKYYIGIKGFSKTTSGLVSLKCYSDTKTLSTGDTNVNNLTLCTYTATTKQLVFIETTDERDTRFFNITCPKSYTYSDDTLIYDDDGDYIDQDACVSVVLEAGQNISFVAYNQYGYSMNINIYTIKL